MKKEVVQIDRVWSAITEACTDLLRMSVDISEAVSTLREIRFMINQYNIPHNPCLTGDIGARIRCELRNLEDMVVIKAANELGIDYANELSNKLVRAWEPTARKSTMLMIVKEARMR